MLNLIQETANTNFNASVFLSKPDYFTNLNYYV